VTDEQNYWLAIAGDTNCEILARMGYPYYALSRMGTSFARAMKVGERCILYRARAGKGFIGIFEITGLAVDIPTRVGGRVFATKVPWRPLILCENRPAELVKLAPMLSFVVKKRYPGAYFQTNLRRLSAADFALIEAALKANLRGPDGAGAAAKAPAR
jgi:hypothetical protein